MALECIHDGDMDAIGMWNSSITWNYCKRLSSLTLLYAMLVFFNVPPPLPRRVILKLTVSMEEDVKLLENQVSGNIF